MPSIDPVILELRADVDQYRRQVRTALAQSEAQLKRQEQAYQRLERQVQRSSGEIRNSLRTVASTIGTYFGVREVIQLTDAYTSFTNQLRVAGLEGGQLESVQEGLFEVAQRYGVELESLGQLYGRVSQATRELGVSQREVLDLTETVAAAVRVQGGSAESASGAMLQLSQALSSGTVRMEEINSVTEGLYPLLLAAAQGSDRFGGSVAALRAAVRDGTVSSKEFFDAIQAGSETLKEQANTSVLTLSQSFTILRNALSRYVSEASEANGSSAALARGIQLLADNVESIIPAVTALAVLFGVRMVYSAAAAVAALGALRLTIAALTVGLSYITAEAAQTAAIIDEVGRSASRSKELLDRMAEAGDIAGTETDKLGNSADGTRSKLRQVAFEAQHTSQRFIELAGAARMARVEMLSAEIEQGESRLAEIENRMQYSEPNMFGRRVPANAATLSTVLSGQQEETFQAYADQSATNSENRARLFELERRVLGGGLPPDNGPTGAVAGDDGSGSNRGRRGPSASELEQRYLDQLDGLYLQRISAEQSQTNDANQLAALERDRVTRTRDAMVRAIRHDDQLTEARKAELIGMAEEIHQFEMGAIALRERERVFQEQLDLANATAEGEQDTLRLQSELATTTAERRRIELRILDAQHREEEARLEAIAANEDIAEIDRQIARARLQTLRDNRAGAEAVIRQRTQSPGERYLDELTLNAEEAEEALERVRVNGLQSIEDGLLDLVPSFDIVGGAFGKLIDGMIQDLLRFAIQQNIIRPLAENLFGGGGGGGGFLSGLSSFAGLFGGGGGGSFSGFTNSSLINSIGTNGLSIPGYGGGMFRLPGRASGGPVSAGQSYIVGENGREVLTMGQSGYITPNQALGGQGGNGMLTIRLGAGLEAEFLDKSARQSVQIVSEAAPAIADAGANLAISRSSRPTL